MPKLNLKITRLINEIQNADPGDEIYTTISRKTIDVIKSRNSLNISTECAIVVDGNLSNPKAKPIIKIVKK